MSKFSLYLQQNIPISHFCKCRLQNLPFRLIWMKDTYNILEIIGDI